MGGANRLSRVEITLSGMRTFSKVGKYKGQSPKEEEKKEKGNQGQG